MISVLSHIIQIVVLASRTNALLTIRSPLELRKASRRVNGAEEDALVLVHSRIGKEESRVVVRNARRGRNEGVGMLLLEVGHELTADLLCRPVAELGRRREARVLCGGRAHRGNEAAGGEASCVGGTEKERR